MHSHRCRGREALRIPCSQDRPQYSPDPRLYRNLAVPILAGARRNPSYETWTDDRRGWPDFAADMFDKIATGGKTFADFQRGNIRKTLLNLKNAVEQEVSGIEGNVG